MKILLGDFNAKVRREDIFKPTRRNENLYKIRSDNGATVVNLATSITLSRVQYSHITKFINTQEFLLMGNCTIR
jgi:hypothetical protein